MKKTSITLAIIYFAIFNTLQAQHVYHRLQHMGSRAANDSEKSRCIINGILSRQQATSTQNANQRTMEIAERLIGVSVYNITDTPIYPVGLLDTGYYTYSGSRNSIFDYNHMCYNTIYFLDGGIPMGFGGYAGFPDHNNAPSILFDSALSWSVYSLTPTTDSLVLGDMQYALYDTNYNVIDWADLGTLDSTTSLDEDRFLNSYDSNSNITSSYALSWTYGYWDTAENRTCFYNTALQVAEDSSNYYNGGGSWTPAEKWYYTYDDSGNTIFADEYGDSSGVWQEWERIYMRYNTTNKLVWDSSAMYNSGIWLPNVTDTFGYTSGIGYYTSYNSFSYGVSGVLSSWYTITKHTNSDNLPDTMWQINYQADSTIIGGNKFSFQYDSYQEPTIQSAYAFYPDTPAYTSGTFDTVPQLTYYYYYETYTVGRVHTAVPTVPAPTGRVVVYPNPATGMLYITWQGFSAGAYTSLTLTNALGQRVRSESLPWMNATESMSLQGLPAGVYWLTVQDRSGAVPPWREQVVKE